MRKNLAIVLIVLLTGIALGEGVLLGWFRFRDPERARAASSVLRGQRVAQALGCFACHGPGGVRGSLDPTSPTGSVPSWSGGTHMMYLQEAKEIREYILDGLPARLRVSASEAESRLALLTIRMPAYRGLVNGTELEDLVSYFMAVSWFAKPSDEAASRGRDLSLKLGCLGCHGPEGRGLIQNPGSLKGFIPPWDGGDYDDLVQNDGEFDEWVTTGEIARFRRNPAAAYFLDRQIIKMPPYRDRLEPGDLEALRAFVRWVRLTRQP